MPGMVHKVGETLNNNVLNEWRFYQLIRPPGCACSVDFCLGTSGKPFFALWASLVKHLNNRILSPSSSA